MESDVRRMKRILLTILQLAVTIGMLWWVFHDRNQRAKMWEGSAQG